MIVDANILLYAVDRSSPHQPASASWLESVLGGDTRVGFPPPTLVAFTRIATHPRVMRNPMTADQAAEFVDEWLAPPVAWVPTVGGTTWRIAERLLRSHRATGNLVPDALLAAVAIENGVPVVSADTDFARFDEVTWVNPLTS